MALLGAAGQCHMRHMFGSLSSEEFLARYWQRAPVLFRGAFPDFRCPIDPDELAGLSCEQDVESRLVQGHVDSAFRLEHGPFSEARFKELPERDWTLLVQDVDKHVPEVAKLLEPFRFIPDWRVDDVMVSFAAPGGSVGPHTDQYDVFLLQGRGRRRWQLSERFDPALRSDCDLKVLCRFETEQEYVVEPGDLLYLPPNVAHYGLALDEALTLSIGFRAPDQRELVLAFADELSERADGNRRFSDPGRRAARSKIAIESSDLAQLRQLLRETATLSDRELERFVGRYLTRPKPHLEQHGKVTSPAAVRKRLRAGARLARRNGSRWAHFVAEDILHLFVDGRELLLSPSDRGWIEQLCDGHQLGRALIDEQPEAAAALASLLEYAALSWAGRS